MDKPMSNFAFRFMSFGFRIRDYFMSPKEIVKQAGIRKGHTVLDYGCGPGSYSIAAAEIIGESGRLYAVDIKPLSLRTVKKKAEKKELKNIVTILTDCKIDLPDDSIDLVLFYDIYHNLNERNKNAVLNELHRILKPNGLLSFSDHHLKEGYKSIKLTGLFTFKDKKSVKQDIYTFIKN
jgi:ubiquinone/menaquinone biosynthesis C-methylase UbiE